MSNKPRHVSVSHQSHQLWYPYSVSSSLFFFSSLTRYFVFRLFLYSYLINHHQHSIVFQSNPPLLLNMDTPRTRTGTDPIIRIDIPVQQIEATHHNNGIIICSGNWICTISQQPQSILEETGCESDLEVIIALQRPPEGPGGGLEYVRMLAQYSHLSVVTAGGSEYWGDDGQGECLQEVAIRQPEMLLQGVQGTITYVFSS